LRVPHDEDLVPAEDSNERGHFESKSVVRLNNRLLRRYGGTWSTPPLFPEGWEADPALDDLRAEASSALRGAFGPRPIVFKDPRTCMTLPFWRTVVPLPAAAVLVVRDPVEVAQSLHARSGLRIVHGLAMWERHVRAAAANLEGLDVLSTGFERALSDAGSWCGELVDFLAEVGVKADPRRCPAAIDFLDAGMRHQRPAGSISSGPPKSAQDVYETLVGLAGVHRPWRAPELGTEPEWVADVLGLTADLESLQIAHNSLLRSRAYRTASLLWRATRRQS